MSRFLLAVGAFALMEPFSYASHRWIMHGRGMVWHRSHHLPMSGRFEANDLFPVIFAGFTILVMAAGATLPALGPLLTVGTGVTAYGAVYMFVHDVYIHRRVPIFRGAVRGLEWLRESHRIHHLFGGEPYGMLLPIVPRRLRDRARGMSRDPLSRTVEAVDEKVTVDAA